MNLSHNWPAAAAAGVLALTAAGGAWANAIAAVAEPNNFTILTPGEHYLPGMLTPPFLHLQGQRTVATFTSECAVKTAFNGNYNGYTDVDIVVVHAFNPNSVVHVLAQTQGNADAFCSSNGTAAFDGFATHSVTAFNGPNLGNGNYRIRVRARLNNGATGAVFGPRTLVVWR